MMFVCADVRPRSFTQTELFDKEDLLIGLALILLPMGILLDSGVCHTTRVAS